MQALRNFVLAAVACSILVCAAGCRHGNSFDMSHHAAAWQASLQDARQQLSSLHPAKHIYLTIDNASQWQNPFLTVETNMIQLRIYLPDENASQVDRGGLTRLSAARKQVLNVRLADLPRALAALPDGAWPYGRVVALRMDPAPPAQQARLRSNFATTASALEAMDITLDDWNARAPQQ